jgi:hypothetical protein
VRAATLRRVDSFRWIAVALSMLLGIGVTRLLAAGVSVFRSRTHARLDWIPLVWAVCVFLWQIQFWWAIVELGSIVEVWTLDRFLLLVALALSLFVAAALVLPPNELAPGDDLRASFERDGRWALVALSIYFVLALLVDWKLWSISPWSVEGAYLAALIVLPIVAIAARRRRTQALVALAYLPLSVAAALHLSPSSY